MTLEAKTGPTWAVPSCRVSVGLELGSERYVCYDPMCISIIPATVGHTTLPFGHAGVHGYIVEPTTQAPVFLVETNMNQAVGGIVVCAKHKCSFSHHLSMFGQWYKLYPIHLYPTSPLSLAIRVPRVDVYLHMVLATLPPSCSLRPLRQSPPN